jgi:hypothetical protein
VLFELYDLYKKAGSGMEPNIGSLREIHSMRDNHPESREYKYVEKS